MFFRKTDQQTNEQFLQESGGSGENQERPDYCQLVSKVNNFDI